MWKDLKKPLNAIRNRGSKVHTLIISGGNIDKDFALDFIKEVKPNIIIAVDKGLEFADHNGILIDIAIGDFDSVNEDTLWTYQNNGKVRIETYPDQKDATDTQLAVEEAIALGSEQITLLGATGSRLDHVGGNVNCLMLPLELGIKASIVDANNHISLIRTDATIRKSEQFGEYVSFLPFGGEVTGLYLKGFKYPLNDYTMDIKATIGISNEIVKEIATVSLATGILMKIESRD